MWQMSRPLSDRPSGGMLRRWLDAPTPSAGSMTNLPSGAVTFLFSDIEGSTRLVKVLRERYAQVLAEHRRLVRTAIASQAGHEVDTQGDAFLRRVRRVRSAVLCALQVQRALAGLLVAVRGGRPRPDGH